MGVLSKEQAEKEVNQWLDFKKVSDRKRSTKENIANILKLVNAFEDGILSLDPTTHVITQELLFPVGKDGKIDKLNFVPRIPMQKITDELKGVQTDDIGKFMLAYIAAVTGETKNVLVHLDTEDYSIASSISAFFQ
jgi:type I restriction-modification system DNA methylase subunit